ncbi:MAG: hypothetical protein IKY83_06200 [Proteobacteria bacterium]|nr:hypothetical protein [Pseudomonadota bacterium]
MPKCKLICGVLCVIGIVLSACEEDNTSTLASLNMPGDMHVVERCLLNGRYEMLDETACDAQKGSYSRILFAANMGNGTLSYIDYSQKKTQFSAVDITRAVPGVTSIPTGERPQSVTGDRLGAFVVLTSAIQNDLSIVSVSDRREIAYQELDKTPRKIVYQASEDCFYVFFLDGTIRRLDLSFDCGSGSNVLTETCSLSKDNIRVSWQSGTKLAGSIRDYVAHPTERKGYVTFSDRRYVSVVGFDSTAGGCLVSGDAYPCEVARLGAGFGCADGIDNDGNGLIDAEDPSCFYPWSIEGTSPDDIANGVGLIGIGACNDGIDNDGNGFVDALDPGCVSPSDASEAEGYQPMTLGTCGDGQDNNGDGDIDRDDAFCRWPTGIENEESGVSAYTVGLCRDGLDNDRDGLVDDKDLACYGKNGFGESSLVSSGRGPVGIDPRGRWLYVLDPEDSQVIVIDLETGRTIDRSGWFPRSRGVGIPVSRLGLDIVGDIREEEAYNKNGHKVSVESAVAYVSSSNGSLVEYLIHQKLTHTKNDVVQDTAEELAMRVSDLNDDATYIGVVRCVGRICSTSDLPEIGLRERPAIAYFADAGVLSDTNPLTGKRHSVIYDTIMGSETWRIAYEGALEREKRTDGHISEMGVFKTNTDLCALGVEPGDHLIFTAESNLRAGSRCDAYRTNASGAHTRLEWKIEEVRQNALKVVPTGLGTDAMYAPVPECFTSGIEFEIRTSGSWIVTSKSSYVNRKYVAGGLCIDDPRRPYGQTRFKLEDTADAAHDAQTAFFSIDMPPNAVHAQRDEAYEFTTRTGLSILTVPVSSAPTAIKLFRTNDVHFLLISDASAHSVIIYDVDAKGIDDTL